MKKKITAVLLCVALLVMSSVSISAETADEKDRGRFLVLPLLNLAIRQGTVLCLTVAKFGNNS